MQEKERAVLEMVEPRLQTLCDTITERTASGSTAFQKMVVEGHLEHSARELASFKRYFTEIESYLSS